MNMERQIYYNVKGESFIYRNVDINFISVLEAGYIITPEGEFIPVKDEDDHSTIFSEYLTNYLGKTVNLETIEATDLLIQHKHTVYMGIKLKDSYKKNGTNEGIGLLVFPQNIEDNISEAQKKSCIALISSNKKRLGTGEIIEMKYYSLLNDNSYSIEYTKEEIIKKLENKQKAKVITLIND